MSKLVGPEGCTEASHGGIVYKADEDGVFDVADEAIGDFTRYHGFKPYVGETEVKDKAEKIEKLEKPDKLEKTNKPKKSDILEDL